MIQIAVGQELIAAIVRNAPEPSGRHIVGRASIHGVNHNTVATIVEAVRATAPDAFAEAPVE